MTTAPLVQIKRGDVVISHDPVKHRYWIDDRQVPSVTQILGVLDKPGLPWWGMKIGVAGLRELSFRGKTEGPLDGYTDEQLVALLTANKLTVNHVRDSAGARGSSVHGVAERYAQGILVPSLDQFPSSERGYVEAFANFVVEREPEFRCTEVIVGHGYHGFAGTFDAHALIDGKLWLLDYKTSKGVFQSHFLQLAAYMGAAAVNGLPNAEECGIVHLRANGTYKLVPNRDKAGDPLASFDDFVAIKRAHDVITVLKTRSKGVT